MKCENEEGAQLVCPAASGIIKHTTAFFFNVFVPLQGGIESYMSRHPAGDEFP